MREQLLEKIREAIRLARADERAAINAAQCGTDWDYKKAHQAEAAYEAALTEVEALVANVKE